MKAKWIWYYGDFENYHHLLLSCRREEMGCDYPCVWHLSSPEKNVRFVKEFVAETDSTMRVVTHSKGMVSAFGNQWRVNTDIPVPKGEHCVEITLFDIEAFPSIYIDSEYLKTDETWVAESCDRTRVPVGYKPLYLSPKDDPRIFPFCYEPLPILSAEKVNGGILYDFGKETFGPVTVEESDSLAGITLVYGESRKEALDETYAVIRETLTGGEAKKRPCRAFRYVFAKKEDGSDVKITAEYEYLPLKDIGSFRNEDDRLQKIWDVCAYTFHLNSREFFLDGIKRDRWVWSGDAYQSFVINRCLFHDDEITERTLVALLGKPPYKIHINTINDYSAYLIIAVYEHITASGNRAFLKSIFENLKALFTFVTSRLDENGLSVKRSEDWVFIDWGVLDKDGPHCAEQILLWKTYIAMTELCRMVGETADYTAEASALKKLIQEKYWSEEKGAFIDSFTSGKNFVSRQTNVFAVLFGFADEKQKSLITENVMKNPDLPAITTPYFKLYELLAFCECNMVEEAQRYILSYWGKMLDLGATSVWEFFDETQSGDEHLDMYGKSYGKSLCHAWGSGPILLLISKVAGINATSEGSKTYLVKPNPGLYRSFDATAPIGNGTVKLQYSENEASVFSTVDGGILEVFGKRVAIPVNERVTVKK